MIATEDWMNMHVLAKQGLSYAEIAPLVGRDWRTGKRAVAMDSPPRYQRAPRGSKLDPYRPYLDQAVARGVLRATRLFRELQAQGYPGGYELVKIYVGRYKRAQRQRATVRFETLPGVQAQADWGAINGYRADAPRRPASARALESWQQPAPEPVPPEDLQVILSGYKYRRS
jgi:transposase